MINKWYYYKTLHIMHTFFIKINLWKRVYIIHRSIILPFHNQASFITSEFMSESKQNHLITDALQFSIKQVMKAKLSKCYAVCHWVRRLKLLNSVSELHSRSTATSSIFDCVIFQVIAVVIGFHRISIFLSN